MASSNGLANSSLPVVVAPQPAVNANGANVVQQNGAPRAHAVMVPQPPPAQPTQPVALSVPEMRRRATEAKEAAQEAAQARRDDANFEKNMARWERENNAKVEHERRCEDSQNEDDYSDYYADSADSEDEL